MTNHPTGDTALSRAITTGAPVATNDKQAAELTQKWGEFTTRGSTVYRDDTSYAVCVNPRAATSIARRLNAADAMEKTNASLRRELNIYRNTLIAIQEYWNGRDNERAMLDACEHNKRQADAALIAGDEVAALRGGA